MPRVARLVVVFVLCWSFAARVGAQTPDSLIRAADLLKIKQLGTPAISPDGKHVVYTVRSIEERAGQPGDYVYRTQLWMIETDGRAGPRQLTRGETSATAPVWHPKGDRIAFTRTGRERPQIWVLPFAPGGEAYPVTRMPQGASHPRWSPDGAKLLFSAPLTLAEARTELEETHPESVRAWPAERPGRQFADTADPARVRARAIPAGADSAAAGNPPGAASPGAAPASPHAPSSPLAPMPEPDGTMRQRREWLARNEADANPRVATRLDFLAETDLEPVETFSHLYIVDVETGGAPSAPRLITPGYIDADDAAWIGSDDTPHVVFSGEPDPKQHPDRTRERALWILDPQTGVRRHLLREERFAFHHPTPSPDGKNIAFLSEDLSKDGYSQNQVGVVPLAGGAKKLLTAKLDRNATRPKWSRDGRLLYFTAATNGGYPLYRVPAAGGNVERLTGPADGTRAYDLHEQMGVISLTTLSSPYELYRVDLPTKAFRLLTAHNTEWLRSKAISVPQRKQVTGLDEFKFDAWIIQPAYLEGGKKYPLLVAIHGGPQAMWGPAEASMWHEFQYFAARGYGIVYCNPRGSGGYGYDFQRANYQNWGAGPAGDVLAAVDLAMKEPWVDPNRLVVAGGSYGGYLTAWIVAHDHRFKAAIAQRGIYDLATFFGEGNAWRLVPYQFGGYPWQSGTRRLLDEQSPINFVADIKTPILIELGDNDRRVGTAQSEMFFRALKVLNRPVEMVRYPRATHELSRSGDPRQRIDRMVRFDEFFRRFIGE